jgi:hypothetical protein
MNKNTAVAENVSPQDVYVAMCAAASQDPAQVEQASARLIVLLEKFGTYDALQEIAATKSVALPVRQASMIQFKNAVLSHWKSRKYVRFVFLTPVHRHVILYQIPVRRAPCAHSNKMSDSLLNGRR